LVRHLSSLSLSMTLLPARSMGGRPADPSQPAEREFEKMVHDLAKSANLSAPPKVFIIPTREMNAFAAGTSSSGQVAAVTSGLLNLCTPEEIRAVMAHEIGHLANGDGKTMMQMIAMNAGFFAVLDIGLRLMHMTSSNRRTDDPRVAIGMALAGVGFFFVVFGVLFQFRTSRRREFAADASSVAFTRDNRALASALRKMETAHSMIDTARSPLRVDGRQALYGHMYERLVVSCSSRSCRYFNNTPATKTWFQRISALFSTHPTTEDVRVVVLLVALLW
jgi:Zn-dependent protease with chaperone function